VILDIVAFPDFTDQSRDNEVWAAACTAGNFRTQVGKPQLSGSESVMAATLTPGRGRLKPGARAAISCRRETL
jgi:hypothetical protein